MRRDECSDIIEDLRRWASQTTIRVLMDGATPAALVEGVDEDILNGETVEKLGVTVAVVTKAMEEEEDGVRR